MSILSADVAIEADTKLGESPLWDHRNGTLVFVDISRGNLHSYDPDADDHRVRHLGRQLAAVGLMGTSQYVGAMQEGFGVINVDGESPLAPFLRNQPSHRMNDARVDSAGRFWGGCIANDLSPKAGSLVRCSPSGDVTTILGDLTLPNGLDWSPDGKQFYLIDSVTHGIDVFDHDVQTGSLSNGRRFAEISCDGLPDGLVVDTDGGVWVAIWGGSCVIHLDPKGRVADTIDLPVSQVTSCTFGGADMATLFITTASQDLSDVEAAREPHAGALFAVGEVGSTGSLAHRFGATDRVE